MIVQGQCTYCTGFCFCILYRQPTTPSPHSLPSHSHSHPTHHLPYTDRVYAVHTVRWGSRFSRIKNRHIVAFAFDF